MVGKGRRAKGQANLTRSQRNTRGECHFTLEEHVETPAVRENKAKDGGDVIAPNVLITGNKNRVQDKEHYATD